MSHFWYNRDMRVRMRSAQAAVEYLVVFASLVIVVSILYALVHVERRYAVRTERLVTSDCP